MIKFSLNNWLWVGYPVAVVVFIIIGINFFLSGGAASLEKLQVKKEEVESEQMRVERLKIKLDQLQAVDIGQTTKDLERLLKAVPSSRTVWNLITELNLAAVNSGMTLTGYKGSVGSVRDASESGLARLPDGQARLPDGQARLPDGQASPEAESTGLSLIVTYDAPSMSELAAGLAQLEKLLPLVRIVKAEYITGEAENVELTVEGAWAAWVRLDQETDTPLPDFQNEADRVLGQIANKEDVNSISTEVIF